MLQLAERMLLLKTKHNFCHCPLPLFQSMSHQKMLVLKMEPVPWNCIRHLLNGSHLHEWLAPGLIFTKIKAMVTQCLQVTSTNKNIIKLA